MEKISITIGTDKQIAYAKDKIASDKDLVKAGIAWLEYRRAVVTAMTISDELKAKQIDALDKLPSIASFWLNIGFEFDAPRTAMNVFAGFASEDELQSAFGSEAIYKALRA